MEESYSIAVKNRLDILYIEDEGNEAKLRLGNIPKGSHRNRSRNSNFSFLYAMNGGRREKERNDEQYNELNRQIKAKCTEAKEECLKRQCDEIDALARRNSRKMHEKVKELTGREDCQGETQ